MIWLLIPLYAILNRARGTQLFGLTDSTVVGRLASMCGMALLASLAVMPDTLRMLEVFGWLWASLMLWCTPGWDYEWCCAIGHPPQGNPFITTKLLMKVIPVPTINYKLRLWGLLALTMRMQLILPAMSGLTYIVNGGYWPIALALLFGLPYYIWGYLRPSNPIGFSEPCVGAIIGLMIILTIGA